MKPALYTDYVKDLQVLFDEIDTTPEKFRSFDLHIDLVHKGMLFVYETRRKLGQTDSIYYARMAKTGASKQVSQKTASDAVAAFFGLGPFVAMTGDLAEAAAGAPPAVESQYPSCAVAFTYRRTGMEKAVSMKMIFLGLGDENDAPALTAGAANGFTLVDTRPFHAERVWEWK